MDRKFHVKEWGETINLFQNLSKRKSYIFRFRLEYYQFANGKSTRMQRLKGTYTNILGLISFIRYVIVGQIFNSKKLPESPKIIIHLSNSNSFLKTILPVSEMVLNSGKEVIFLCPANHLKILKKNLPSHIAEKLVAYENIKANKNLVITIANLTICALLGIFDMIWFSFQNIEKSFLTSFSFGKYAFVHHYFDSFWVKYFSSNQKILMAADDKYLWEITLFEAVKKTNSKSFVFQHGKTSDLYYPTSAKTFCTWSEGDLNKMITEYKASPDEIICIGSPYFDIIYKNIKSTTLIPKNKRQNITFLGQPYYLLLSSSTSYYKQALEWFYSLAKKEYPVKNFILKPHPHDDINFYQSRPIEVKIENDNIIKVLEKSFFMATIDSTSVLEAAVCETPSIQLLPKGFKIFSDDSETKISLKVETYEEFEALALKLYNDPEFYQKTIDDSSKALHLYFANLGHSLEKIKELIQINEKQI